MYELVLDKLVFVTNLTDVKKKQSETWTPDFSSHLSPNSRIMLHRPSKRAFIIEKLSLTLVS